MKYLIALLLTISTAYAAEIYYNPLRSGEGAVVAETEDGRLAMIFFGHTEVLIVPPASPSPPDPIYCDEQNIFLTMVSDFYDGEVASGIIYYEEQNEDFPLTIEDRVSNSIIVGEFSAEKQEDGFILIMERDWLICNLSIFGEPHYLTTLLAK